MAKPKLKRPVVIALLVGLAGLCLGGLLLSRLLGLPPEHWYTVDPADPIVQASAQAVERRLPSEMSRVRDPDAAWVLRLKADHVNHWLAVRLPLWAANQGIDVPSWLRHPMVAVDDERVHVSAAVSDPDDAYDGVVLTLGFRPLAPDDRGVLGLGLADVYINRVRVPPGRAFDFISGHPDVSADQIARWEQAVEAIALRWTLPDGRVVEVVELDLADGEAAMRCRTVSAGQPN